MEDLKKMSMSELIGYYNSLATAAGLAPVTEFKNLAAGRAAIQHFSGVKMSEQETQTITTAEIAGSDSLVAITDGTQAGENKYSTVGKRGPNQGIGEFAKQLLMAGVSTADTLTQVRAQFPTAKTSASCIAYYKAALKNPNLGKRKAVADPAALRAKATELLAAAEAAEKAAVEAANKAAADAKARAEAATAAVENANRIIAAQKEAAEAAQAAAAQAGETQPQAE